MADGPNGPAEIVKDKYDRSVMLANSARATVDSFQAALNNSIYNPPQISVKWTTLAAPNLPPIPNTPSIQPTSFTLPAGQPGGFSGSMDSVAFDSFTEQPPMMDFGTAPTLVIGSAPSLPQINDVAVPAAPVVTMPAPPSFLALTEHTFGGINLHEDWMDRLDDIPSLSIVAPEPFRYDGGRKYASGLLDMLKATLSARINGGTGIPAAVEQQLWDRARDRETQIALAKELDVTRAAEALGFPLPSGVLAAQLTDARREYHDKLSGLSRDIAIKQAELEQQNVKDSVATALQLESTLLDESFKLENLAFEAAKAAADNAIQAHNAALQHFTALLDGYKAYASVYDTVIRSEVSKIEAFKAMLAAEQAKADINKSLVDRYKAEIEAGMASVEIYKARVNAAQTLVEMEKTRMQAGGEQIKAFVATVNAETAKVELYKARVSGEAAKGDAYRSLVQAYSAKVGAQAEQARVSVAKYQAQLAAKGLEWDGWKAKISGEVARVEAAAKQASIIMDGYRIGAAAAEAQAGSYMRRWEADIKQYEAGLGITMETAKTNAAATTHANDARMEAAKIGLASSSQQLASAWAMVSAAASISGSDTTTRNL